MLRRICLITNYNQYESKRYFVQKLSEALNRKNILTKIVDAQEGPLDAKVVAGIQRFAPDLTASFNSLLPMSEHKYLWDFLQIPHISFLVDPALYNVNLTQSPYSIISSVDRFDCAHLMQYQFQNVFFWPHAVERELVTEKLSQDRPYDVVFLGSCYDYEKTSALLLYLFV